MLSYSNKTHNHLALSGVDVGVDVGVEMGVDVGVEMGVDVGVEMGVDVGMEMGVDVEDVEEGVQEE